MDLFRLYRPTENEVPVVINVPHAGEFMPAEIIDAMACSVDACKRDLDLYVDEIWADAPHQGATLLAANVSRYVVDLNRAADDVSEETVQGGRVKKIAGYYGSRGVVWRTTTRGEMVIPKPLSEEAFKHRIDTFHAPYHAALANELQRVKEKFGYVIMIDGHSMPSQGRKDHPDTGKVRADVVPGDADGTACALEVSNTVVSHFKSEGYSVALNDPYKGAWDTRHYGQPQENIHAIQIELNRKLYMNEETYVRLESMQELADACIALIPKLAKLDLNK